VKRDRMVLVVDDEKTIADGLRLTLEAEGYDVRTAGSVRAALEALAEVEPHAAIVDLMLPDGDGLQLTRELKRRDPAVEVVVITAYGSVRRAMEATKDAGAFYVLEKPFDPDELLGLVGNALERRPRTSSCGAASGTRSPTARSWARRPGSSACSRPSPRSPTPTPTC